MMTFDDGLKAFEEQRYEEALAAFRDVVYMEPGNADAHYNIACCHVTLGNPQEAKKALKQAIYLNPAYRGDALADNDLRPLAEELPEETEPPALPTTSESAGTAAPAAVAPRNTIPCPACGTENHYNNWKCNGCGMTLPHSEGTGEFRRPVMDHYKDTLFLSIFCTLCCCLPTGIVAIVYSANARSAAQVGDMVRASQASKTAQAWCWVSIGLGVAYILIQLLVAASEL